MITHRLEDYLVGQNAVFQHTVHPAAPTALTVARQDHVPAREMAKAVIACADGAYLMAVLPANRSVEFAKLRQILRAEEVRIATEFEMSKLFPDVEVGAVPPIGALYDLPVLVDETLAREPEIAFNAGTHTDSIHMSYAEFDRLTSPRVCAFASPAVFATTAQ
ncbi:MAG: YbaK/EbsC family protein [Bryobacteraceae bacterium]